MEKNRRQATAGGRRRKVDPYEEMYPDAFIIKRNIEMLSRTNGTRQAEMAAVIGCSTVTFRDRMKHPYKFPLDELTRLGAIWGCTVRQMMQPMQLMAERTEA